MSNINPIATTKVANAQGTPSTNGGSTSGVFANGNFWDTILAQLNFSGEAQAATVTPPADAAKKPVPANSNPLAMLQVALASQTVDANGNIIVDAKGEKLQTQLGLTNKIIDFIKGVTPDSAEQKGLLNTLLSKLQTKSDTLQASIAALESGVINKDTPVEDIPFPMLIALGLSPSEISQVTDRIQDLEKKLGREITVEDLIAGVGGLLPAQNNAVVTVSVKKDGSVVLDGIDKNTAPTDDLAAQLNAMDVGGEEATDDEAKRGLKGNVDIEMPKLDVKADVKADTKTQSFKDNLVNMFNDMKTQAGEMIFPITYFDGGMDGALTQPYGMTAASSLSFGSTAQAANMVSANVVAGQPHPATQTVAANIMKNAKDGIETMTLRLDPPELGNVNVRLQFGKDKMVKAHIVVEKPETYMMLQRDAQSLERALQTAGLDTSAGEAISFELAQDNSAFGHDNNGQGAENNFGGGASGSQNVGMDGEILQSSMTWNVDPSTGHVRYNIFV